MLISQSSKNQYILKKNLFLKRFKNKGNLREKLSERFSYSLMGDPDSDIKIGSWYSEIELREKADIHRARLSKYGRSKMNGEMLYVGPKGGVYKYNSDGKKKYL
ncbi:hypothetical protein [Prochlorococcus sp. MIT 1223]|uniref:hypothetical protein n=1 Tax=Prochlorococcus sp. MIT 1223 TaxID=3096217 RepID=UPI002A758B4A|nr:hypothetical protein [Prochlorococcus sp. MIT 1223]